MQERLIMPQRQHEALLEAPEHHLALPDAKHAEALRPGETDPRFKLQEAHARVAAIERSPEQANPLEGLQAAEKTPDELPRTYVDQELKRLTLRREMQQVRRHLSWSDRQLSQVIHQPAVRAVSEAAGQTLSRPSGLLGGGLTAFLGSAGYLYLAKHIGFTYNYFVFWLLLAGGFGVGVLLETLVWALTARHRRTNDS